jgi:hypothetical protein
MTINLIHWYWRLSGGFAGMYFRLKRNWRLSLCLVFVGLILWLTT